MPKSCFDKKTYLLPEDVEFRVVALHICDGACLDNGPVETLHQDPVAGRHPVDFDLVASLDKKIYNVLK